jgi:hypothetical protein
VTVGRTRGPVGLLLSVILAACTIPPLLTPSPRPARTASPSPTASPEPTPSPTPSPSPTPEPLAPDFEAGDVAATTIDGLRVRSLPGTDRPIVTGLLPLAFELEVVMGPLPLDGLAWYLVADADPREPNFEEGWVAAGFEPDPLLAPTGRRVPEAPYVASMSGTADAEQGPVEIGDGDHAIRWAALDEPERRRCSFAVSMIPAGGSQAIPAIRATIGTGIDRGTLQPQSFSALRVRGPTFVDVASDCAWALTILRIPPQPSPTPGP